MPCKHHRSTGFCETKSHVPDAPTNLIASPHSDNLELSWIAPT